MDNLEYMTSFLDETICCDTELTCCSASEMVHLLEGLEAPLQQMWRTARRPYIGTCSATGFMEMAVRSGVRQRALSLVGGAFGERFAGIAL